MYLTKLFLGSLRKVEKTLIDSINSIIKSEKRFEGVYDKAESYFIFRKNKSISIGFYILISLF